MRTILGALAIAVAGLVAGHPARAQTWPTRPIMLVVPFTAGVTSDVVARSLAEHAGAALGQNILIENRGGAGGNIGAGAVARAEPDGYTLLLASTAQVATNKLMYASMTFDPQRDLVPVVLVGKAPVVVAAGPKSSATTLADAIAYAKRHPGALTVGFPGNGTLGHITGILLQQKAGMVVAQAQYRGSGAIVTDLLGGHIDLAMDSLGAYVPPVQEGRLRALAIASRARWPLLPDVPTVSEAGLPGFEASVWYAIMAPARTPPEIVARVNAAVNAYLRTPGAQELFAKLGMEIGGGTPADLQAFTAEEIARWAPIIKAADIRF